MKNHCTALTLVWESGIIKNLLLPTCEVIKDYFDNIVIAHCGPRSQAHLYEAYKHIPNVQVEMFDYKGEAESVMNFLASRVPENEWAYFFDSDQRPTPDILLNLDSNIDLLNSSDCGYGCFPTIHHEFRDDGTMFLKQSDVAKTLKEAEEQKIYMLKMLAKITKAFRVGTHQGMHYNFNSDKHKFLYFPQGINHYKLYFEYYSSIFLSGYSNPRVHSMFNKDKELDDINQGAYDQFEVLKQKLGLTYSNDFKELAYRNQVPPEFIAFFSTPSFLRTNNPQTTHFLDCAATFCTKYKFSFNRSFDSRRYCGNPCCNYNGVQL